MSVQTVLRTACPVSADPSFPRLSAVDVPLSWKTREVSKKSVLYWDNGRYDDSSVFKSLHSRRLQLVVMDIRKELV